MSRIKREADKRPAPADGGDEANVAQFPDLWPWPAPVPALKLEPWQYLGAYDPAQSGLQPLPLRQQDGKGLRRTFPHAAHGAWKPAPTRPDPVEVLVKTNEGRQERFVPIRMGRMAASPFGFLRGACAVMAWDLAQTPVTGLTVILDGDAHLNNFGLYGTPQRDVVFDLNDFDEGVIGPWEWDLKRLAASINVAGRENGLDANERRAAVLQAVYGYRFNARRLQDFGVLETWYLHAYPGRENPIYQFDPKTKAVFTKAVAKAERTTSETLLLKACHRDVDGAWRFFDDPPLLTRIDDETAAKIVASLVEYCETIPTERRYMLKRYRVVDIAHRIVGVGSVGTRAYLVLLFGSGDQDPLFLQVKEAARAAHAPYLPLLPEMFRHEGRRIVAAQRALQSAIDVLLGWTTIDGRPYYVRQMKNMKASVPVEWLAGKPFEEYALVCGAILARAHARTGDAAKIAAYCGQSESLDEALADFAEAYGDQTERDHESLVKAIKAGRIDAVDDV
jgi:uncharacterized protein (DUF2252 family)